MLREALHMPALWPLAIVAGEVGMDAALTACRTRVLPGPVEKMMASLGYTASSLPPSHSMARILLGIRVEGTRRALGLPASAGLVETSRRLGISPQEAAVGLRALAATGWRREA